PLCVRGSGGQSPPAPSIAQGGSGQLMPPRGLPFPPMEAELVTELPEGNWQYEPKWDGFRGVMENLKGELAVWSRNARPLLRYFPELREVGELLPPDSAF